MSFLVNSSTEKDDDTGELTALPTKTTLAGLEKVFFIKDIFVYFRPFVMQHTTHTQHTNEMLSKVKNMTNSIYG